MSKVNIYEPIKISASHYYKLEKENKHYLSEEIIRQALKGFKEKDKKEATK